MYTTGYREIVRPQDYANVVQRFESRSQGPLHDKALCEAQVFTLVGVESVRHMRKRCSRKSCRAHYCYNYASANGRKTNVLEAGQMEYIFVSTTTGTDPTPEAITAALLLTVQWRHDPIASLGHQGAPGNGWEWKG